MKALSIKQPWASLIAHGIKDIENRTWRTNYRGRIYIHSSGKRQYESLIMCLTQEQQHATLGKGLDTFHSFPTSAIIGEVDIVDCVINHSSIWAEKTTGIYTADGSWLADNTIYNWVLANPVLYEKPIPCKGKLSFWEPDIHIEECIGCSGKFDYEIMEQDSASENYCHECWDELMPLINKEFMEMVVKGEIDYEE